MRIGTYRYTVWRWKVGLSRSNTEHMMALVDLTERLGLARIFSG